MNIDDLRKEVTKRGLQMNIDFGQRVFAEIYHPHRNYKFEINGKKYSNHVLSRNDVMNNINNFRGMIDFCYQNELQVMEVSQIEYNFVSSIFIIIRDKEHPLDSKEMRTNFELSKTYFGSSMKIHPKDIDMTEGVFPDDMFVDPLSRDEKEHVLENIIDLLSFFNNRYSRVMILGNLAYNGFTEPMDLIIDEGQVTVPEIFSILFYSNKTTKMNVEKYNKKIFSILFDRKTEFISLDSNYQIPEEVLDSITLMKKMTENWDFSLEDRTTIFERIVNVGAFNSIKVLLNADFDVDLDSWQYEYSIQPLLENLMGKYFTMILEQFKLDSSDEMTDEFISSLDSIVINIPITQRIELIQKAKQEIPEDKLFNGIISAYSTTNVYGMTKQAPKLVKIFEKSFGKLDLSYADCFLGNMCKDDKKLLKLITSDKRFIDRAIELGKIEFLSKEFNEVFLF